MAMKFGPAISQEAISEVAKRHGVPEEEVRKEMELALLMAWGTGNNEAVVLQDEVFPEGMPDAEEFISRLAEAILGILQPKE